MVLNAIVCKGDKGFCVSGSVGMADEHDSGSCVGYHVRVQVPSSAFDEKEGRCIASTLFLSKTEAPKLWVSFLGMV